MQTHTNIFFTPSSLGALPALWLQDKLTTSLAPFQDKFAKLFLTIAAELWLRGCPEAIDRTFQRAARSVTIRLAEQLAKYICSLLRHAAALATPEIECLLYATYWFRPIFSELIGAATETAATNRVRAPSGPVKVIVTTQPHSRLHAGVNLVSGVSALLAWFPASWASKIAPCFLALQAGTQQGPQEVAIACPTREGPGLHRDPRTRTLQAVRFADNKVPGLNLEIDEDFQASQSFTTVIRGYSLGVVEPTVMHGFKPTGPIRVFLEVITPSIPWRNHPETVETNCYSVPSRLAYRLLLRLWHHKWSLHQFADLLNKQLEHRHMFSHWAVNLDTLACRVSFSRLLTISQTQPCKNIGEPLTSRAEGYGADHLKLMSMHL